MLDETTVLFLIFFARVLDVSLGTVRIILISRGYRYLAPLIGFFEIMIWLIAINKALKTLGSPLSYFVYAGGFATGNYVGMWLEERISLGYQAVRTITTKQVSALPLHLREEGFGVTLIEALGMHSPVYVLFSVIKKRDVKRYKEIVEVLEPKAFITVEDVRSHYMGFVERKVMKDFKYRGYLKKK